MKLWAAGRCNEAQKYLISTCACQLLCCPRESGSLTEGVCCSFHEHFNFSTVSFPLFSHRRPALLRPRHLRRRARPRGFHCCPQGLGLSVAPTAHPRNDCSWFVFRLRQPSQRRNKLWGWCVLPKLWASGSLDSCQRQYNRIRHHHGLLALDRPTCSGLSSTSSPTYSRTATAPTPSFIVDDTSSPLPCLQDMALSSAPSQSDQIPISQADQPSLGYLDEALSFIAQERARWSAARLNRASNNRLQTFGSESTSADDFEHEYEYEYEHEHDMNAYDETLGYTIGDYLPFLWVFSLLDSCHVMLST